MAGPFPKHWPKQVPIKGTLECSFPQPLLHAPHKGHTNHRNTCHRLHSGTHWLCGYSYMEVWRVFPGETTASLLGG